MDSDQETLENDKLVENILAQDPIMCALTAQIYTEQESDWSGGDAGRIVWFVGMVDSVKNNPTWKDGKHFGDCTKCAISCNRCHLEDAYQDALSTVDNFRRLCNSSRGDGNANRDALCVKLLAILIGTQYLQSDWNSCLMRHLNEQDPVKKKCIKEELDNMFFPDPTAESLKERCDIWEKLDSHAKKESEILAGKFVEWVVDRPTVPGVP